MANVVDTATWTTAFGKRGDAKNRAWIYASRKARHFHLSEFDIAAIARGVKTYWPPALVPEIEDPHVLALGPGARSDLLCRTALATLHGVDIVERRLVEPATNILIDHATRLGFPAAMADDARHVLSDEAYHQFESDRLLHDLEARLKQPLSADEISHRARAGDFFELPLRSLAADLHERGTVWLGASVETQISDVLKLVPGHRRVAAPIANSFKWHNRDEAEHRVFFSRLFEYGWRKIEAKARCVLGSLLANCTRNYLSPDLERSRLSLVAVGLNTEEAHAVIAAAYPELRIQQAIRQAATASLKVMRRAGVFEDAEVRQAFIAAGLIDDAN